MRHLASPRGLLPKAHKSQGKVVGRTCWKSCEPLVFNVVNGVFSFTATLQALHKTKLCRGMECGKCPVQVCIWCRFGLRVLQTENFSSTRKSSSRSETYRSVWDVPCSMLWLLPDRFSTSESVRMEALNSAVGLWCLFHDSILLEDLPHREKASEWSVWISAIQQARHLFIQLF